jgi:hypothetical protein
MNMMLQYFLPAYHSNTHDYAHKKGELHMKKLTLFLLILSCASYAYNEPIITQAAINKRKCSFSPCSLVNNKDCPRGPRGHHGRRGHKGDPGATGATGATGAAATAPCGMNELFSNAIMMLSSGEDPYDIRSQLLYGPDEAYVPVWTFFSSNSGNPIGLNFNIPIDLDNTQPVTVIVHFLIEPFGTIGTRQINFQVSADYKGSNEVLGFVETVNSGDFTVFEDPINDVHISKSVSLDPSLMTPGDWAFLSFIRVPPTTNEYHQSILLTTISFQYTRVCS